MAAAYITPIQPPSGVRSAVCLNFFSPDTPTLVVSKSNRLEFYDYNPSTSSSIPNTSDAPSSDATASHPSLTLVESRTVFDRVTSLTRIVRPKRTDRVAVTDLLCVTTSLLHVLILSFSPQHDRIVVEKVFDSIGHRRSQESQFGHRAMVDPANRFLHLDILEGISTVFPIVSGLTSGPATRREPSSTTGCVLAGPLHCRTRHLSMRSSAFLYPAAPASVARSTPRMAMLYEDPIDSVWVRIVKIAYLPGTGHNGDQGSIDILDANDDSSLRGTTETRDVPAHVGATHVVPVSVAPFGFLVLGQSAISWHDGNDANIRVELPLRQSTIFTAWVQLTDTSYALADEYGTLHLLNLDIPNLDGDSEISWSVVRAGTTARADVLVKMPEPGYIFVGSHQGSSALVKVSSESDVTVETVQTFSGVAPILDFAIFDLGKGAGTVRERYNLAPTSFSAGQAGIVIGSGSWDDGSLSLVRKGVYWKEHAVLPQLALANRLFPLRGTAQEGHHSVLAVSFIESTVLLDFSDGLRSVGLITTTGLNLASPTLLACDAADGRALQVTPDRVVVCSVTSPEGPKSVWMPPDGCTIALAKATRDHLLVLYGHASLAVLSLHHRNLLQVVAEYSPDSIDDDQISSIDIRDNLICAGFWSSQTVRVACLGSRSLRFESHLSLASVVPDLGSKPGGGEGDSDPSWCPPSAIPRDVCISKFSPADGVLTVLVSLDFGIVVTADLPWNHNSTGSDLAKLSFRHRRVMKYGSMAARFERASDHGSETDAVLVMSDYMGLLLAERGGVVDPAAPSRMKYSLMAQTDEVASAAFFSPPGHGHSIAFVGPNGVVMGEIGDKQTTLVSQLPIRETIRRVGYCPEQRVLALGTIRRTVEDNEEKLTCRVALVDDGMAGELDSFLLRDGELVECVVWAELPTGPAGVEWDRRSRHRTRYCLVGTSCTQRQPSNPAMTNVGRLIVLECTAEGRWSEVTSVLILGGCRCVAVTGSFVVAGLSKTVALFGIEFNSVHARPELTKLTSFRSSSTTIDIVTNRSHPNQVAVLDLMRSVHLLEIVPETTGVGSSATSAVPVSGSSDKVKYRFRLLGIHPSTVIGSAIGWIDDQRWLTSDVDGVLRLIGPADDGDDAGLKRADTRKAASSRRESVLDLGVLAEIRIGEMVNRIRLIEPAGLGRSENADGSDMRSVPIDPDSPVTPRALLATVDGSIHMVGLVAPEKVEILGWLQHVLATAMYRPSSNTADKTAMTELDLDLDNVRDTDGDDDDEDGDGVAPPGPGSNMDVDVEVHPALKGDTLRNPGMLRDSASAADISDQLTDQCFLAVSPTADAETCRQLRSRWQASSLVTRMDRTDGAAVGGSTTTTTTRVLTGPGSAAWRFIDGELIERFLDLSEHSKAVVVRSMNKVRRWYRGSGAASDGVKYSMQEVQDLVDRLVRMR